MQKFDVVLADPPWPYYKHHDSRQPFAEDHYTLMTLEDIYKMPVLEHTHVNSILLVWATGPKLEEAITCINRWGFIFRGVAFTWIKVTQGNHLLNGAGPRPSFIKPISEFLLWGTRIPKGRPLPLFKENTPNQICALREGHSVKPGVFHQEIAETLGPTTKKLELFARRHVEGWHCTGYELTGIDYREGRLL